MRIAVNLLPLVPGRIGGSETYARAVIEGLADVDRGNEYLVFASAEVARSLRTDPARWRMVVGAEGEMTLPPAGAMGRLLAVSRRLADPGPASAWAVWDVWQREATRRLGLDCWFHPLNGVSPCDAGCASVVTVQDLQHEDYPWFFTPQELGARARFYQPACLAASRVIVPSQFVRDSMRSWYGVPDERLDVVHDAHPPPLAAGIPSETTSTKALARYGVRLPFALYPANTWAHKNHTRLLDAMERVHCRGGGDLQLVLTGAACGMDESVRQASRGLEAAGAVRILGYVPREDLLSMYQQAQFLVFPSLYEGFGIPIVEAMQAGCPVTASRMASIPEVAGDAALYFDAENAESIFLAMLRMHTDEGLRKDLVARGREQVMLFSAERCAVETLGVLEMAVGDYRAGRAPRGRGVALSRCTHLHVYDGAFLAFRCPRANKAVMTISRPPQRSRAAWLRVRHGDREVSASPLPAPGRTEVIELGCKADHVGVVRLDFAVSSPGGPWAKLRGRLWAPAARIERLVVHTTSGESLWLVGK